MRYELPSDPETLKFLKLRALVGGTVLLATAVGFASLAAFTPSAPTHVSVNCIETAQVPTLSDADTDPYGCTPLAEPATAKPAPKSGYPAPAAGATRDEPPIATF
jgi:hypothetical protein